MKRGEIKLLHSKTIEELQVLLSQTAKKLFESRMELSQNKLKNTKLVNQLRKDIARIKTALKLKEDKSNAKNPNR